MSSYAFFASVTLSVALAATSVVLFLRLRAQRSLLNDVSGPLSKMASSLALALSRFASGDLRARISRDYPAPLSSDGSRLAELLSGAIGDFNASTDVPSHRVCFTGANSYQEGRLAGEKIAALLGGSGSVACVIPYYNQINHVLRMKGCCNLLNERYPGIKTVGVYEGAGNRDVSIVRVGEILAQHPSLDVLFVTDGHTPPSVVETIARKDRNEVRVVAFDAMPENVALLRAGKISCLIEQNSFAQAFNALVHLYNARETGWQPLSPKLFMEPIAIDVSNLETYWDSARNERIMMDAERAQLAVPERNRSGKKWRFGLILPLSTGFFEGLGRGGEAARKLLADYDVEIEIVDAFHSWEDFGSASVFDPVIDRYVASGFDGFATVVVDPAIVKSVNRAVRKGLAVTTFNTEPSSFREIVLSMIENVERVAANSQDLAAAAEESSRATGQIGSAIAGIKDDIHEQKARVDANDRELEGLNAMISSVREAIGGYADLVERMTGSSREGSRLADQMFEGTRALKTMIDNIESELASFSERLSRVQEFATLIEQLAENTNVLAINASIQAARAGTAGKAFAVVAGEVRTLAENSRHTAEGIREMVSEITSNMAHILEESGKGSKHVTGTLANAQDSKRSFETISSVIGEAGRQIARIEDSMEGIAKAGVGVKQNMDMIDRMSNTSVSRLDEITVSVGELGIQGTQLSQTANELRSMATNQDIVFAQLSVRETEEEQD